MATEKDPAALSTPPKYSRYRSQRQSTKIEPRIAPVVQKEEHHDLGRTKSMARYRRPRMVPNSDLTGAPMPPVPSLPRSRTLSPTSKITPNGTMDGPRRVATSPIPSPQEEAYNKLDGAQPTQGNRRETEQERARRKVKELQERERQERKVLQAKEEMERELRQRQAEAEARQAEEENARILATQKRKDLERLQAELDAAAPRLPSPTSPKDKFKFFSKKRSSTKITSPPLTASGAQKTSLTKSRSNDAPQRGIIGQGGGGIVPQTDAPISASNAGERVSIFRAFLKAGY